MSIGKNLLRLLLLLIASSGTLVPTAVFAASFAPLEAVKPVADCASLPGADISVAVGAKVRIESAKLYEGVAPFCGVRGTIAPSIGFAVKLPTAGWTQRYLQVGCGGLCGMISLRTEHETDCVPITSGASVIAFTDMGHSGRAPGGATWGSDKQMREDFAHRGVHLTALAAKALIRTFYGRPQRYAYFSGCSDGGREALIEAQRYPQDFDGIAAGAPAMNFVLQNTFYHAWQARSNIGVDGRSILLTAKLPALHRAAVASCDAVDGLKDGQITDPRACRFDPVAAQCRAGATASDDCLTPAEVAVARKFYEGPRDAAGHRFTLGGPQVGSELSWRGVYVPDAPNGRVMSPGAALDVINYLAFPQNPSPPTALADFRFNQATFEKLRAMQPLYDSTDPNLAPFEQRGGKLILYHGWSDPHISPINTIAYYESVGKLLGEQRTRGFARLFMVPGLYHCGGGDGTSEFDILTPLMAWVESGSAPDMLIAGRPVGGAAETGPPPGPPPGASAGTGSPAAANNRAESPDPFQARLMDRPLAAEGAMRMERTRPVYAYPQVARYSGSGSIDVAASFSSAAPLVARKDRQD